jgi:hypothetical protein
MRAVPADLAAAIESPERVVRPRLSVDWDGDGHGTSTAPARLFLDTFDRDPVASAWGNGWTVAGAAPSDFATTGTTATQTQTSVNVMRSSFAEVGSTDVEVLAEVSIPIDTPTGAAVTQWVCGRVLDANNYYAARLDVSSVGGNVNLTIFKRVAGTLTSVTAGITIATGHKAGDVWWVHFVVRGDQLMAKAWMPSVQPMPPTWQLSGQDTSLTTGTQIGLLSRLETGSTVATPMTVTWHNVRAVAGNADDLSDQLSQVKIERTVTGQVPDQCQVIEGIAAAVATADLVKGDRDSEKLDAYAYASRFNVESPLYGKERAGRDVKIGVDWLTDSGWQHTPRLTKGTLQALPVDVGSRSADLEVIDARDRLRTLVRLPGLVANSPTAIGFGDVLAPGLEASWVAAYAAFQCGLYLAPPPSASLGTVLFYAPMYGSAQPFISRQHAGVISASLWTDGGDFTAGQQPCAFTRDAPFFMAADPTAVSGGKGKIHFGSQMAVVPAAQLPWAANGRANFRVHCWVKVTGAEAGTPVDIQVYGNVSAWFRVSTAGQLSIELENDFLEAHRTAVGPTITLNQWVFVGVHIDDAAGRAAFRVGNTTTVATFTPTTATSGRVKAIGEFYLDTYAKVAEVTLRTGIAEAAAWPALTYTPDYELDRLQNRDLMGIFPTDRPQQAWDILQELVSTERGLAWLDYDGKLRIWSRARLNTASSLNVQRTLTTDRELWELGYDDSRVMVRNVVTVPYQEITARPLTSLWALTGLLSIEPGQTLVWNLTFPPHGGGLIAFAGEWSQNSDGSGAHGTFDDESTSPELRCTLELTSATTATVTLKAGNSGFTKYFVDNQGVPTASLTGTPLTRSDNGLEIEARSQDSIDAYGGELPLQVSNNPWSQTANWAKGQAHQLLGLLSQPQVVFTSISAPLDPRLEPLDRFKVQDARGLRLDGELLVEALGDVLQAGAADMELVGRQARKQWVLGSTPVGVTMLGGGPE